MSASNQLLRALPAAVSHGTSIGVSHARVLLAEKLGISLTDAEPVAQEMERLSRASPQNPTYCRLSDSPCTILECVAGSWQRYELR